MSLKVNFAGVPDQTKFEPVPAGIYTLLLDNVVDSEVSQGDNAGEPMFKLTWEIQSEDEDLQGKKVFDNLVLVQNSLWRLKAMMKAFGFEIDDSEGADDIEFEFEELLGKELQARLSVSAKQKDRKTGNEYPAKNKIAKFIIPGEDED
jgi:Protein of unknown function (DUF669)